MTTGIPSFIVLHGCCIIYKLKTPPSPDQQKDHDLLYCDTLFIVVGWSQIRNNSDVCLYILYGILDAILE